MLKNFTIDELLNTNGYQLNKGVEILKKYMKYYNAHPITTKTGEIIENLNLAKDAMIENIEKLLDRNNKMEIIAQKSDSLKNFSINISSIADNVRKNESSKKSRLVLYGFIIIVILIVLYLFLF